MIDCSQLHGRMRAICDGTSGLPEETRQQYLALWEGKPPPQPQSLVCIHRGEHIDWVDCPTCQGKSVRFKTFGCQLHGTCVMTSGLGQLKGCVGCESRMDKQPE